MMGLHPIICSMWVIFIVLSDNISSVTCIVFDRHRTVVAVHCEFKESLCRRIQFSCLILRPVNCTATYIYRIILDVITKEI